MKARQLYGLSDLSAVHQQGIGAYFPAFPTFSPCPKKRNIKRRKTDKKKHNDSIFDHL
jgi:hypothetical protein